MPLRLRIAAGLALLLLSASPGCDTVQDSTQPPIGSISAPPNRDDDQLKISGKTAQPKPDKK
jgi:hypothetical protein